jgi:hypothetical protein
MPVEAKLNEWESRLDERFEGDAEGRGQAAGLIGSARSLLNQADSQADQLLDEFQAANQATGEQAALPPSDDALESEQRSLASILDQLFELFGGGGEPFTPIEIAAPMEGGAESVQILPEEDRLAVKIGGAAGVQKVEDLLSGPLSQGRNARGLGLVREVLGAVTAPAERISRVRLLNNKIEANALAAVDSDARTIASQVSRLGTPMKISSLERASRIEGIAQKTIPFRYDRARNQRYKNLFAEQLRTQLSQQEQGLNRMTIDEWAVNVNVYRMNEDDYIELDRSARNAVLEQLNERAQQAAATARQKEPLYRAAISEINAAMAADRVPDRGIIEIVTGRFGNEAAWRQAHREGIEALHARLLAEDSRWKQISRDASRLAVLHNPDQVAGGPGDIPDIDIPPPDTDRDSEEWDVYLDRLMQYIGASRVNSAIGSGWGHKIDDVYREVTGEYQQPGWPIWRLNFKLDAVEGS